MIRSMTTFARSAGTAREGGWTVEIRSINHRYFDFSLKLPPSLGALEGRIRELVQSRIPRGKVTLSIGRNSGENGAAVSLNEEALKLYLGAVSKLKKRYRLSGDFSVADLLRLPGIFSAGHAEENVDRSWRDIQRLLDRALKQAIHLKEVEGKKLAADMLKRLQAIQKAVLKIESAASGKSKEIFQKLCERVDALLTDKEKDIERTHREVAFLAEKSDITEEIVRLKSHLGLFRKRLQSGEELGRELDFLCQEMNREVNTMASKAQLFEVSTEVVFIKGELEKIREQIQNIE